MTKKKKISGTTLAVSSDDHGFSLISKEKLLALYAAMVKCRMLDERLRLLSPGKTRAAFRGREAIAAGIVTDLLQDDTVCAQTGDAGPRLLKGVPLRTIVAAASSRRARSVTAAEAKVNVLPPAETFAERFEAAIRAARRGARPKKKKITVFFCGSEGPKDAQWEDSLRSAATERLPVLFVCQGHVGTADLAQQAQRCGLPGITVDEEDAVAIYRVASEAMAHARRGNGPTLIECKRWLLHGAPSRGNAVRTMEAYLAGKGLFNREFKDEVVAQFTRELDKAAR
ncbi:MAG TPA: thiamine pyrophosphate-dependent enzyme [Terracidiphilus sp.]|nr:thiamine pyrophosphate-dependent enzyme [Terracidiphilus sp.]